MWYNETINAHRVFGGVNVGQTVKQARETDDMLANINKKLTSIKT
jgi:hypothetical protein